MEIPPRDSRLGDRADKLPGLCVTRCSRRARAYIPRGRSSPSVTNLRRSSAKPDDQARVRLATLTTRRETYRCAARIRSGASPVIRPGRAAESALARWAPHPTRARRRIASPPNSTVTPTSTPPAIVRRDEAELLDACEVERELVQVKRRPDDRPALEEIRQRDEEPRQPHHRQEQQIAVRGCGGPRRVRADEKPDRAERNRADDQRGPDDRAPAAPRS